MESCLIGFEQLSENREMEFSALGYGGFDLIEYPDFSQDGVLNLCYRSFKEDAGIANVKLRRHPAEYDLTIHQNTFSCNQTT